MTGGATVDSPGFRQARPQIRNRQRLAGAGPERLLCAAEHGVLVIGYRKFYVQPASSGVF
jgi:hypothetical protein